MSNSQDYTNAIFESMDILINKKIEQISFDSTIEATIIDASQASKGIYMVSNGNASFTATSAETGYKEKDIVLVTVPEGNYDNQKIIISKKQKSDTDSPLIFKSPFDNLIDISNNIISGEHQVSLIANGGKAYGWNAQIDFKQSEAYNYQIDDAPLALIWDSEDLFEQGEFNHPYIGLKAQFSTWLNDYHTTMGNYGLAMELIFTHRDYVLTGDFLGVEDTEIANILKDRETFSFSKFVFLDSDDFFGNVYNFETYYSQEQVFDISDYMDYPITRIRLFAYQRNNFIDINQKAIYIEAEVLTDFSTILPNIFIKDPYICFGELKDNFTTDSATLVSGQGLTYIKTLPILPVFNENNSNFITGGIDPKRDIVVSTDGVKKVITKILAPQIREKNAFFKMLKKVYSNKGYPRKRIIEIFNALVFALNEDQINNSYLKCENEDFFNLYEQGATQLIDPTGSLSDETELYFKTKQEILNELLTYENRSLNNKKEIELRWIHQDENSNHINAITTDIVPENYHIYWYIYKIGASSPDEFMGAQWVRFYGCYNTPDETGNYCISEEDLRNNVDEDLLDLATDHTKVTFYPNVNINSEQLRAVIVKNEEVSNSLGSNSLTSRVVVRSDIMTFNNQTEVANKATIIDTNALALRFEDNEQGNYFLYNRARQLFSTDKNEIRSLVAVFDLDEDKVINKKELSAPCNSIRWIIPAKNTMIISYAMFNGNRVLTKNIASLETREIDNSVKLTYDKENDNYIFEQTNIQRDDIIYNRIFYSLEQNLNYLNNRNTIYIEINKDGQTYTAQAQCIFGTAGVSGSDYTIVIDWENKKSIFDINKNKLSGQVSLIDQSGRPATINEDANFEYSWYQACCAPPSSGAKKQKIKEENFNLYYPVNNEQVQKISQITYQNGTETTSTIEAGYFANPEDETGLNGEYSIITKQGKLKTDVYKYDLEKRAFEKVFSAGTEIIPVTHSYYMIKNGIIYQSGNPINNPTAEDISESSTDIWKNWTIFKSTILYAKSVYGTYENNVVQPYTRNKIEFRPFDKVEINNSKKGVMIEDEFNQTIFYYDDRKISQVSDFATNFKYYRGLKRAFIKYNDIFILDPYDQYYENLTYYYPVEIEKNEYEQSTLKIVPDEKDNSSFSIQKNNNQLSINDLYILQVKLNNFGDYDLIARFPIGLKQDDQDNLILDSLEGATEVRYSTSGELDFNKASYMLHLRYKENGVWTAINTDDIRCEGTWELINWDSNIKSSLLFLEQEHINLADFLKNKLSSQALEKILWCYRNFKSPYSTFETNLKTIISKISVSNRSIHDEQQKEILKKEFFQGIDSLNNDSLLISFIQCLIKNELLNILSLKFNNKPQLLLPSVYFKDMNTYGIKYTLTALNNNEVSNVSWTQPIYIYQDNYPSTTLNQWGGKEIITDNSTGLILANGFSAGKKEKDNTFTGVVLGDWSKSDTDSMITKQTGIFGFNHGIMSYALKDDGTAFFGAEGSGRLYFNGTNATIYSGNWIKSSLQGNLYKQNAEGMKLDINTGELLIQRNVLLTINENETFLDNRKITLNSQGFIISRNHYELSEDSNYRQIKLFELQLNNDGEDSFEKISYAFRTPDYIYNTSSGGREGTGMEINLGTKKITSFGQSRLQLGGYSQAGNWYGWQFLVNTKERIDSDYNILSIGKTGVHDPYNFTVATSGSIETYGSIRTHKFIEIQGEHAYSQGDYSLVCWKDNEGSRGNIYCGNINCTQIQIGDHVLTIKENTSQSGSEPSVSLCVDGYPIEY